MKRRALVMATLFAVATLSQEALATCAQNNNKLGLVGLDSSNGIVYARVSDHDNACGCNEFRFMPDNTDTKMALSVLLSARVSSRRVRIDVLDPTNCNSAHRVYIQDPS